MENQDSTSSHPPEAELAAYLGGELRGDPLMRMEAHLADCPVCRRELIDATEILRTRPRMGWKVMGPLVAAAAVAALVFPTVVADRFLSEPADHRDAAVELLAAPAPLAPMGDVAEARTFVWSRVPGADRYRVRLFDAAGTVLWETSTADSTASLSDSLVLESGRTYLWQVEARVGWDVWESSGLVEFVLDGAVSPPADPGS
jgi:hypothetical protein